MKKYESPFIEVIIFDIYSDVITGSKDIELPIRPV